MTQFTHFVQKTFYMFGSGSLKLAFTNLFCDINTENFLKRDLEFNTALLKMSCGANWQRTFIFIVWF